MVAVSSSTDTGIVVIVAHRPSALAAVDMIAVIQNGKLAAFGPKDEIISSEAKSRPAPAKPAPRPAA